MIPDLIGNLDPAWLLIYARIQACILALPVLSERWFGVRLRVSLAVALSPFLMAVAGDIAAPTAPLGLVIAVGQQLVLGFLMGVLVRLVFLAINIAATAIASTASLSQIIGTGTEASPHPIGNLLNLAASAIIMALGFHLRMVDYLADSMRLWPPGGWPDAATVLQTGVATIMQSFALAMILSAPFIIGGFLYQTLSGVVSRVMPSLPVSLIGAPAAILLALIALVILAPSILSVWTGAVMDWRLPDLGMAR
ncbi:flagellar biosynthetic protein FliR [Paracoccus pacificus]|uniref:Flagellar biosynthetic protein FliR n=1 Tax=Paracoccus pacificus TaxID=1463598 RepID=A0ABW4RBV7_9RHOB